MQVSDWGLIIPEFPTTSLLCAFQSIMDYYLNHICVSVRKPCVLCNDLPVDVANTGYNIAVVACG